jgi:hypothetical protein
VEEKTAKNESPSLRVSLFDRAWSWLLALLLLIGATVLVLVLVWLSNHMHSGDIARDVGLTDLGPGDGGGDGRPPGGTQLESPDSSGEQIEINDRNSDVEETLVAASETASETVKLLEDPSVGLPSSKGDLGTGGGKNKGDGPGKGPGHGPGPPGVPGSAGRAQRWQIKFDKGNTLETYARQLDCFNIELAVLTEGDKIVYLSKFSAGLPAKREGPRAGEKRIFFLWQGGDLKQADLEFFRRAKVSTESGKIYMFIPRELETILAERETAFQNKSPAEIKKTIFKVLPEGNSYAFKVVGQMLK